MTTRKRVTTKYPVYIPSKGRHDLSDYNSTAMYFKRDGVPFQVVVEPQEFGLYASRYGAERVLALPFSNLGLGSIPARNWLWDHAKSIGAERHWCVDDNIWGFVRTYKDRRIPCESGLALRVCEEFVDRYENVAIGGLNYRFFGGVPGLPPFFKNVHVYSCMLIKTDLAKPDGEPYRWRGRYNEDTDLCLQALASGEWCTVLLNAFLINKQTTLTQKGGNMEQLYQGDGRLNMSKSLQRAWQGAQGAAGRGGYVVSTGLRYARAQHVVRDAWKRFDTELRLKPGVDLAALSQVDEFGQNLKQVRETVKSDQLRQRLAEWQGKKD